MLDGCLYGKIILTLFMGVCAATDLLHREIGKAVFAGMLILTAAGYIWMAASGMEINWTGMLAGISVGLLMAFFSFVTKGGIGMGDAIFFGVTGLVTGGKTYMLFAGGILLCAAFSLIILTVGLIRGTGIKDRSLPFIPFVFPVGVLMLFFIGQQVPG